MADNLTPEQRKLNMRNIRSVDTKPEIIVRKFLHKAGFRFRIHAKNLPGKPDLVLRKYNTAIFIHGCFWHGHEECRHYIIPKTQTEYWLNKINNNKTRDQIFAKQLQETGWNVVTVWECTLKKTERENTLNNLTKKLVTPN